MAVSQERLIHRCREVGRESRSRPGSGSGHQGAVHCQIELPRPAQLCQSCSPFDQGVLGRDPSARARLLFGRIFQRVARCCERRRISARSSDGDAPEPGGEVAAVGARRPGDDRCRAQAMASRGGLQAEVSGNLFRGHDWGCRLGAKLRERWPMPQVAYAESFRS